MKLFPPSPMTGLPVGSGLPDRIRAARNFALSLLSCTLGRAASILLCTQGAGARRHVLADARSTVVLTEILCAFATIAAPVAALPPDGGPDAPGTLVVFRPGVTAAAMEEAAEGIGAPPCLSPRGRSPAARISCRQSPRRNKTASRAFQGLGVCVPRAGFFRWWSWTNISGKVDLLTLRLKVPQIARATRMFRYPHRRPRTGATGFDPARRRRRERPAGGR